VRIVADAKRAYWTTVDNRVESGDFATGTITELVGPQASFVGALGVEASHLFVGTYSEILRVPVGGGPSEFVVTMPSKPVDMVVEGGEVFVLDYGSAFVSGNVFAWSPGTGLRFLFQGLDLPTSLALDDDFVYVAAQGYMISGGFVFEGAVLRIDRVLGNAEVVVSGLRDPFGLALRGDTLFIGEWYDAEGDIDARVLRAPRTGGPAELVGRVSSTALPTGLVIDDTYAYVTVPDFSESTGAATSKIVRVPLAGGEAQTLVAPEAAYFAEPAVTPSHLAFTVQYGQSAVPQMPAVEANTRVICNPGQ
jgi:hypothetical protein